MNHILIIKTLQFVLLFFFIWNIMSKISKNNFLSLYGLNSTKETDRYAR
jgi:hypothetical protein